MPKNVAETLAEARERVSLLTQSLPNCVDPLGISVKSKIPYKVIAYREALIWRTEEIARSACDMYQRNDLAAAILLTRAASENGAAMWFLYELVRKQVEGVFDSELDVRVERLLMGSRNNSEMPEAMQVLTMLDKAEKAAPGIRKNYESLCEYAHPNWSGTGYLYSKIDKDKILTNFGKNPRGSEGPAGTGLNSLICSLVLFEHAYNAIADILPAFVTACEAAIKNND